VGTAIAAALLIGVLSASVTTALVDNPVIPQELKVQVDLDNVDFVSDDRLREVLEHTTAALPQVAEAVRLCTQARLRSLRICLPALEGLALVAIFPVGALPKRVALQSCARRCYAPKIREGAR
jgi:DsbC/DsbD-like thiol-disulfide interchange protein